MKLTAKQTIDKHREQWDWHYHHPTKGKEDYHQWERNGGDIPEIKFDCFLCEYAYAHGLGCDDCLLKWPGGTCTWRKGLFAKWSGAESPKTRKKYAKMIRDLPVKGEVKDEPQKSNLVGTSK